MYSPHRSDRTEPFGDWRLAAQSILGFWTFYYLTVVLRSFLSHDASTIMVNRLITVTVGIALTTGVYAALSLLAAGSSLKRKILVGLMASVIAAGLHAGLLIAADRFLERPQEEMRFTSREGHMVIETGNTMRVERDGQSPLVLTWPKVTALKPAYQYRIAADMAVTWFFFFAAWSAFYIAMRAQREAAQAQGRATEAESAARAAQVRALRYQINPHFLFNTLNSLSSLVMTSRPNEAEAMILKLSTFYRTSLSLDPAEDVSLAEEIALQRLYLDIEMVRFPKRLNVEIDVPADLETARLPALILQPIVENTIKYAVSATRDKVTLRISAREAGPGRIVITVANSGASGKPPAKGRSDAPEGTGVGIANVCQRLQARFGNAASCNFGDTDDGGYRVMMTLPLDRSDG